MTMDHSHDGRLPRKQPQDSAIEPLSVDAFKNADPNSSHSSSCMKLINHEFRALQLDKHLTPMSVFDLIDHCASLFEESSVNLRSEKGLRTYIRSYLIFNYFINTFIMIHFNGFAKFMESSPQDFIIYLNLYNFFRSDDIIGENAFEVKLPTVRLWVIQYLTSKDLLSFDVELLYNWLDEYMDYLQNKEVPEEEPAGPVPNDSDLRLQNYPSDDDMFDFNTRFPELTNSPVEPRFPKPQVQNRSAQKGSTQNGMNGVSQNGSAQNGTAHNGAGTQNGLNGHSSTLPYPRDRADVPVQRPPIPKAPISHRPPPIQSIPRSATESFSNPYNTQTDFRERPQQSQNLRGQSLQQSQTFHGQVQSQDYQNYSHQSQTFQSQPYQNQSFQGQPYHQNYQSQPYPGQNFQNGQGQNHQNQSFRPQNFHGQIAQPQNFHGQSSSQGMHPNGPSAFNRPNNGAPNGLTKAPTWQPPNPSTQRSSNIIQSNGNLKTSQRYQAICGLKNVGSSCYINSTVQLLFGLETLENSLLNRRRERKPQHLSDALGGLMSTFLANSGATVAPTKFLRILSSLKPDFNIPFEQQDAQEFLLFLLDKLHEELSAKPKSQTTEYLSKWGSNVVEAERDEYLKWYMSLINYEGESAINDTFQGHVQSRLVCKKCGHNSVSYSPFTILSLPIPAGSNHGVDLSDCLNYYTQDEVLTGDNAWNCPKCNKSTQEKDNPMDVVFQPKRGMFRLGKRSKSPAKKSAAHSSSISIKQLSLIKLPPVMFIHLSRFSMGNVTDKLNTDITYPLRLKFNHRTHEIVYHLTGVINHFGTLKSGHYTSLVNKVKENGDRRGSLDDPYWCYFDDDHIKFHVRHGDIHSASEHKVRSRDVYVLCYERV